MTITTTTVHQVINWAGRKAFGLAPLVAESAGNSGCTDVRPERGPLKQRAWDLTRLGLALNTISESASLVADFDRFTQTGERAEVTGCSHLDHDVAFCASWGACWITEDFHRACDLWEALALNRATILRDCAKHEADLDAHIAHLRATGVIR